MAPVVGRRVSKVRIRERNYGRSRINQGDQAKPVSANYSEVTLIDSSGGGHKPLFSCPSAAAKYAPNFLGRPTALNRGATIGRCVEM